MVYNVDLMRLGGALGGYTQHLVAATAFAVVALLQTQKFKPLFGQIWLNSYVVLYRGLVCRWKSVSTFALIEMAKNGLVDHRYAPPTKFQQKSFRWHGQGSQWD